VISCFFFLPPTLFPSVCLFGGVGGGLIVVCMIVYHSLIDTTKCLSSAVSSLSLSLSLSYLSFPLLPIGGGHLS